MINTQGKLLIAAFMTILIGVVLIQPIADEIEDVSTGSRNIYNESVSLTITTTDVINESVTFSIYTHGANISINATLVHNYVTALTNLKNESSAGVDGVSLMGECNITLNAGDAGFLSCNATNSTGAYANYTFRDVSTGTLTYDELSAFNTCRNSTQYTISGTDCNVTLTNGNVRVTYDNFTDDTAYINYSYIPDNYVRGATSRTMLSTTRLLFAIFVMTLAAGFAYAAFKQSGAM